MKTKLVQVTTKGQYHTKVAGYLGDGYTIVDKTEKTTVLQRLTKFNGVIFFLGLLFAFVGAFLYLIYYSLKKGRDELVTVEFTQL